MRRVQRLTITSPNKAARRVIAPYVKIIRKRQKTPDVPESKLFRKHLEQKPSVLLHDLSSFLSDNVDMPSLLHESTDILKTTTKALGVSLYLVDSATGEIHQSQRYFEISEPRIRWKIEKGTIVAAHVAATKELVMIEDILEDKRFPMGVGLKDQVIKAVLCVPVVTPDGDCFAVLELFKHTTQGSFNEQDKEIATLVTEWMGIAIYQNIQRVAAHQKQELNAYLLDLTKVYLEEFVPMEKMLIEMVKITKMTLSAERSALYLLDRTTDEDDLVADIYEKDIDEEEVQKHYKVKFNEMDKKLVATVARSGVTANIKNAYNDPKLGKEVDEKTGFILRSALCMPVKGFHDIMGVIEVVNKKTSANFSKSDENLLDVYASYCSFILNFNELNEEAKKQDKINAIRVNLLKRQVGPCVHDYNHFMKNLNIKLPSTFHEFRWTIHEDFVDEIPLLCYAMFRELCDPEELDVPNLARFILAVRRFEGDLSYYNFEHAFHVFHCLYLVLKRNDDLFSPLEVKALLVAALCYCVGMENCTTNEFLMMTNDDIYKIYPEHSWQMHHITIATRLLEQFPIFKNLSKQERKQLVELIKENILSTDLRNSFYAKYYGPVSRLMRRKIINLEDPTVLFLLKTLILACCTQVACVKDHLVARKMITKLLTDFCQEGVKIKQIKPDCLLTQYYDCSIEETMPELQVNLMDNFVLKTANILLEILPNTLDFQKSCLASKKTWVEIIESRGLKLWRPGDSYLKKTN